MLHERRRHRPVGLLGRIKDGRQRQALQAWLTRLVDAMHGRIHGFNVSVAHVWAEQERLLQQGGPANAG